VSKIVEFRQRVIDQIRENMPELQNVDWYDGLFDEDDVREWGGAAPSAYVALLKTNATPHTTGEMLVDLAVVVVVVTQDQYEAREADAQNWDLIERIAVLAKDNQFGDPSAGIATNIDFKRMRHPELRREAVAVGLVEWTTNLTIGVNKTKRRNEILGIDDSPIVFPPNLTGRTALPKGGVDVTPITEE
jgi:hypothetical protein